VPQTIQSRCQRFDFRNIPPEEVLGRLEWMCNKEKIEAEDGALAVIARLAAGSMRDGESLLDQVCSFCAGHIKKAEVEEVLGVVPSEVMSSLLTALIEGKAAPALEAIEKILGGGTAPRQFVSEFIDYVRDCLVIKACGKDSRLVVRSALERETIERDASRWQEECLVYAMQLLAEAHARMARSPQSRGLLDVSILKLSRVQDFQALRDFLRGLRGGEITAGGGGEADNQAPFDASRPDGVLESDRGRQSKVPDGLTAVVWNALVGAVSSKGTLVLKTIEQHATFALSADKLKIGLPANFAPHRAALEKEDVRVAVEDAVSKALGRSVRVEVSCNGAENGRPVERPTNTARKRALRDQAELDPAVRKVLEVFDGGIVEVEE
jgi:DNA polymerase-3 subunit gamma/tau